MGCSLKIQLEKCLSVGILWRTLHIIYNFHIFILHTIHCCSKKDSLIYIPEILKKVTHKNENIQKGGVFPFPFSSGFPEQ